MQIYEVQHGEAQLIKEVTLNSKTKNATSFAIAHLTLLKVFKVGVQSEVFRKFLLGPVSIATGNGRIHSVPATRQRFLCTRLSW